MTFRIVFSYAAAFLIGSTWVIAQQGTPQQDQPGNVAAATPADVAAEAPPTSPAGLRIAAVPQLLRSHLPLLGPDAGLLIESVAAGSPAEAAGLVAGDILIEAGGRPLIAGKPLPQLDPTLPLVVVRGGQPRVLNQAPVGLPDAAMPPEGFFRLPAGRAAVSAQTFATGSGSGEAISVSQVGEQVTIEYDSPQCPGGPVRFSGSIGQIDQQLVESDLPMPMQNRIRRQLGLPAKPAR